MTSDDRDWQLIDQQLDTLLNLDVSLRQERLDSIQEENPDLAAKLERMLQGLERSDPLENLGDSPLARDAISSISGLGPGEQLGAWTIVRRIGHGGMAEVFEAIREIGDGEQRAAIKLMALGLGSEEQRRRFQQETAILARLDDHRLSRLIDAGTAPDGRPWLAMEFIEGQVIDQACDLRKLSIVERVRLLIEVAHAVDYSHRHLVVHRDLKPANILLTPDGQARLLDFGIAKVHSRDDQPSDDTATQMRAYTPRYASPEQLMGKIAGVDSDVYQLGLILYLLLTGARPFADCEDDPLQLIKAMRRGPLLPSQQIALAEDAAVQTRTTHRRRLQRELNGDLDSIVMQALAFDPDRRYPGARELAEDLQRWLDGEPISARQYSRGYRAMRYLRRHWVGASAIAAITLLLVGYALTATWQGIRLEEERNQANQARLRAEAIQDFLLQVFGSVDPMIQDSHGKSVDELLIEAADQAQTEFEDQPELAAQLLVDMGTVLARRGLLEEARQALETAYQLSSEALGVDHPETLAIQPHLGQVLRDSGLYDEALSTLKTHLEQVEQRFGSPSAKLVHAMFIYTQVESVFVDVEQSLQRIRDAIEMHRQLYGDGPWSEDPGDTTMLRADMIHQLGVIEGRADNYEASKIYLEQSVATYESHFGRADNRTIVARKNLAHTLRRLGESDQAQVLFEQVIEDERALYGRTHWQIAYTLGHLGNMASDAGDYDRAIDLWQQAEAEFRDAVGDDHPWLLSAQIAAAKVMLKSDRHQQGREILTQIAAMEDTPAAAKAADALKRHDEEN